MISRKKRATKKQPVKKVESPKEEVKRKRIIVENVDEIDHLWRVDKW